MIIAKEKQKVETFYLVNLIAKLSSKLFHISDHQSIGPKEIPQGRWEIIKKIAYTFK